MPTVDEIKAAILEWPGRYETETGEVFLGCPVSQLPSQMRDAGWRNIGRDYSDFYALKDYGLRIVRARYVGGAQPKRFCDVIFASGVPHNDHVEAWKTYQFDLAVDARPFNMALHDFMETQGATHERIANSFEDIGDPENGPELTGCPGHDIYVLDDVEYVVFEDGSTDRGPAAPPMTEPYGV